MNEKAHEIFDRLLSWVEKHLLLTTGILITVAIIIGGTIVSFGGDAPSEPPPRPPIPSPPYPTPVPPYPPTPEPYPMPQPID